MNYRLSFNSKGIKARFDLIWHFDGLEVEKFGIGTDFRRFEL